MFSVFLEEMKQLTIFLIVGQTILNFGVSKKYEKYVKLILAFMIIAQLVFSIGSYVSMKNKLWKPLSEEDYYAKWEEYVFELEKAYEEQQSYMEAEILEESKEEQGKENEEGDYRDIIIDRICIN